VRGRQWLVDEHRPWVFTATYYLKAGPCIETGLGANLPEDAVYPLNLGDESGKAAGWSEQVHITFRMALTTVNAFWSITLYDRKDSRSANVLNRSRQQGLPSSTPPTDRSIYISETRRPGKDKEATGFRRRGSPSN